MHSAIFVFKTCAFKSYFLRFEATASRNRFSFSADEILSSLEDSSVIFGEHIRRYCEKGLVGCACVLSTH